MLLALSLLLLSACSQIKPSPEPVVVCPPPELYVQKSVPMLHDGATWGDIVLYARELKGTVHSMNLDREAIRQMCVKEREGKK